MIRIMRMNVNVNANVNGVMRDIVSSMSSWGGCTRTRCMSGMKMNVHTYGMCASAYNSTRCASGNGNGNRSLEVKEKEAAAAMMKKMTMMMDEDDDEIKRNRNRRTRHGITDCSDTSWTTYDTSWERGEAIRGNALECDDKDKRIETHHTWCARVGLQLRGGAISPIALRSLLDGQTTHIGRTCCGTIHQYQQHKISNYLFQASIEPSHHYNYRCMATTIDNHHRGVESRIRSLGGATHDITSDDMASKDHDMKREKIGMLRSSPHRRQFVSRRGKELRQHTAKQWWDGVVPPWSSAKYVGRRELRGEQDGGGRLGMERYYHMKKIGEVGDDQDDFHRRVTAVEELSEPSFAVMEVGAQQFKVALNDVIYTEKLQDVGVNDIVKFGRVLMTGTKSKTIIGRPYISDACVVALVEEQFKDGKVFVFKKKRRKNYRRFNTHRQNLTRLRILCLNTELAQTLEG